MKVPEPMLRSAPVRRALALLVVALLVLRFGVGVDSGGFLRVSDILFLLTSAGFAAGLMITRRDESLGQGLVSDRWLTLFTALYLLGIILRLAGAVGGGGDTTLWQDILALSIVYSLLCSLRTLLSQFGRWMLGRLPPAAILPTSFAVVIALGTLALMLPRMTPPEQGIGLVDAAFTSTSATCVTGLIVRSTSQGFTVYGQAVILGLIQVGGLGIMTFVAFFALFLGHSAGLRQSVSLSRIMDSEFVSDLKRTMGSIVGWTIAIESAGAFVLYLLWSSEPTGWSRAETLWQSVFHSVSAFCNAGFSLDPSLLGAAGGAAAPENLEGLAHSAGTGITIGLLIVLGGIGFLVLTGIGASFMHRLRTGSRKRLSLQSRLVLVVTIALVVGSTALFLAVEWDGALSGMPLHLKVSNAFLEGVTPRTAGFNTVPTGELAPLTRWSFVVQMFVGASPGGTGGGVKTSTVALVLIGIVSLIRRKPGIELWKRRIPGHDMTRAAAVILLSFAVFALSAGALMLTERAVLDSGTQREMGYVFESMSAFGTVGLSTGVTGGLTAGGRVVIILTMFLGRIGPAALAAATGRAVLPKYSYPEARITIG